MRFFKEKNRALRWVRKNNSKQFAVVPCLDSSGILYAVLDRSEAIRQGMIAYIIEK